jgi:hypothetical protein
VADLAPSQDAPPQRALPDGVERSIDDVKSQQARYFRERGNAGSGAGALFASVASSSRANNLAWKTDDFDWGEIETASTRVNGLLARKDLADDRMRVALLHAASLLNDPPSDYNQNPDRINYNYPDFAALSRFISGKIAPTADEDILDDLNGGSTYIGQMFDLEVQNQPGWTDADTATLEALTRALYAKGYHGRAPDLLLNRLRGYANPPEAADSGGS